MTQVFQGARSMNLDHAVAGASGAAVRTAGASADCVTPSEAERLAAQLAEACTALWTATLSLMTAFMQTRAPAHRYLIARRIARNLATLQAQDCFSAPSRASFAKLSRRWSDKADRMASQQQRPRGGIGLLPGLFNR
jgi:hypothetical protein